MDCEICINFVYTFTRALRGRRRLRKRISALRRVHRLEPHCIEYRELASGFDSRWLEFVLSIRLICLISVWQGQTEMEKGDKERRAEDRTPLADRLICDNTPRNIP